MKKRIFCCMLMFNMLLSLFIASPVTANAATSGVCGDSLTYTFDESGTLTISGTGDMYDFDEFENSSPWCDLTIQSLVINKGITHIGNYAFSYQNIFETDITIPEGVESIGEASFAGLPLKTVSLPTSLVSIGDFCFGEGENLENIHIPKNVYALGENSFGINIETISVDDENKNFSTQDGILFSKDITQLLCYPPRKSGESYTIPKNVDTLGPFSFFYNRNLCEITVPETIKEIQNGAFWAYEKLTSIELPTSVSEISTNTFAYCCNLSSITIPKSIKTISGSAFCDCYSLNKVIYTGSEENWKEIVIDEFLNSYLINAKNISTALQKD